MSYDPYYGQLEACLNGHVTTDDRQHDPGRACDFCPHCGAATIHACKSCNRSINGRKYSFKSYGHVASNYRVTTPPKYCVGCGTAFPWQESALHELNLMLEGTGQTELASLTPDLTADTARTARAVLMLKTWVATLTPNLTLAANELVKAVATDLVKKQMGL